MGYGDYRVMLGVLNTVSYMRGICVVQGRHYIRDPKLSDNHRRILEQMLVVVKVMYSPLLGQSCLPY